MVNSNNLLTQRKRPRKRPKSKLGMTANGSKRWKSALQRGERAWARPTAVFLCADCLGYLHLLYMYFCMQDVVFSSHNNQGNKSTLLRCCVSRRASILGYKGGLLA